MIWHTYHNVGSYSYDIILNIPCIAYTIFANCITMFSFIALHLNMQYVQHVQLEALHRSAGRWCPALCSTQRWDATHAFDSPEASSSACCSCLATIPISSFKKKQTSIPHSIIIDHFLSCVGCVIQIRMAQQSICQHCSLHHIHIKLFLRLPGNNPENLWKVKGDSTSWNGL